MLLRSRGTRSRRRASALSSERALVALVFVPHLSRQMHRAFAITVILRLSREVEVVLQVVADGIHVLVVSEHAAVEVAILPPLLLAFEIII